MKSSHEEDPPIEIQLLFLREPTERRQGLLVCVDGAACFPVTFWLPEEQQRVLIE